MYAATPITELLLRGRATPGGSVEGLLPLVHAEQRPMADRRLLREKEAAE